MPAPTLQKILLERELPKFDGLQKTRRNELIEQGKYPPPCRFSERRKVWLERDIIEFQQSKIAERDYTFAPKPRESATDAQTRWKPPSV